MDLPNTPNKILTARWNKKALKTVVLFGAVVVVITTLVGCAPAPVTAAPPEPTAISSPTELPTATETPTPLPTDTPEPTKPPEVDYPVCKPDFEHYKGCKVTLDQAETTYTDWAERYAQTLTYDYSGINQAPLDMSGSMIVFDQTNKKFQSAPNFNLKSPPAIDNATSAYL